MTIILSPEHRANLRQLAELLNHDQPELACLLDYQPEAFRFRMKTFQERFGLIDNPVHPCGTTACALGVADLAGLGGGRFEYGKGSWMAYSQGLFGFGMIGDAEDVLIWDFLFAGYWPDDPRAAARRIAYVAEHGAPPADWSEVFLSPDGPAWSTDAEYRALEQRALGNPPPWLGVVPSPGPGLATGPAPAD